MNNRYKNDNTTIDEVKVIYNYYLNDKSIRKTAEHFNITRQKISFLFRKFNFPYLNNVESVKSRKKKKVIHTKEEYEMILVAFDNWKDHNKMSLYYTSSKDGINWNTANVIMKPTSKTNNWDNLGIYRSSFIYEDGKYYVFYGGTSKTLHHGVGLVYGEDIYHLKQFKKEK